MEGGNSLPQFPISAPTELNLLGRYRVLERVGAGGMGQVFRGRDEHLGREVAIKVFSATRTGDHDTHRQLRKEARLLSKLNHPNIASVYDFDSSQGLDFLVMEFLSGTTLAHRLQDGPLPEKEIIPLALQLVDGLRAAHEHGIVHRDLKPANVIIDAEGRLKILDFGLAILTYSSASMTTESEVMPRISGTLPYMAPEQLRGSPVDARSDIYSLGVMLYEMAAGKRPFTPSLVPALVDDILRTPPPPPARFQPHLSPGLEGIILKCLEKEPANRYQSAKEIAADLLALGGGPTTIDGRAKRHPWLGRGLRAGAILLLILIFALGGKLNRDIPGVAHAAQVGVAVLPFQNAGGDPDLNYLQLALPDEVATALSYAPTLSVRPLAVTRRYLNTNVDPQTAGRELRVLNIVTGHYDRQGDSLRITLEAIEPETSQLLWRETMQVKTGQQLELRDRVATRVWQGLAPVLGGAAISAEVSTRPANPEAYDLYLHSISVPHEGAANREAARMLERAVQSDPDYAPAWAALAERYHYDSTYFGGGVPAARQAQVAAGRAVQLDPNLIAAVTELVLLEAEAGRLDRAYDQTEAAVRKRPDSGLAHFALSYVLRYAGLFDEAAKECDTALGLDPTNYQFRSCAITLEMIGQYSRAMDFARLDLGTDFSSWRAAYISLDTGNIEGALAAMKLLPSYFEAQLGTECIQHPNSRLIKGLSARSELISGSAGRDPENAYVDARMQAVCRQNVTALRVLRRAVEGGYCAYPVMDNDPLFSHIRNTPEFGEIRKLGMECQAKFLRHREERAPAEPRSQ
ncbi:MAG: protein kinase [Acidobacteriia bacterium]|nr:protein kinase [Terriglobia bacterium]